MDDACDFLSDDWYYSDLEDLFTARPSGRGVNDPVALEVPSATDVVRTGILMHVFVHGTYLTTAIDNQETRLGKNPYNRRTR